MVKLDENIMGEIRLAGSFEAFSTTTAPRLAAAWDGDRYMSSSRNERETFWLPACTGQRRAQRVFRAIFRSAREEILRAVEFASAARAFFLLILRRAVFLDCLGDECVTWRRDRNIFRTASPKPELPLRRNRPSVPGPRRRGRRDFFSTARPLQKLFLQPRKPRREEQIAQLARSREFGDSQFVQIQPLWQVSSVTFV